MTPSTDLELRRPANELVASIRGDDEMLDQIRAALPENVSVDRFTRALQTALIDDTIRTTDVAKRLVNADRASLFQAVVKCASDGLLPDGKQAALVVYSGKVTYLPMIAGVRFVAAGFGWTIRTHVVYANDRFDVIEGTDQRIEHRPAPPGTDRGALVAAYAVAHHRDGRRSIVEVMHEADIEKAKAVAKTDAVWKRWPVQMWEKTVGHRIAKKLPLDPQDRERLMRVLDAAALEPGEAAQMLYGPNGAMQVSSEDAAAVADAEENGQQAGDAAASLPVASPAPGPDDFGGTDEEPDPDIQAAQDAAAYLVEVPTKSSWVNGLTLAQINARGDDARVFFTWALKAGDGARANKNEELRARAAAYAKVQLPDLYAELVDTQS